MIRSLENYAETPFKSLIKTEDLNKRWVNKEARKLLNTILELELESIDSYIRVLEEKDKCIWSEKE